MSSLPIEAIKAQLLTDLSEYQTLVLTAPPGAGKSTCLPLWLLSSELFSKQKIYLLQPRRIAAKNIACFLAQQLGENVGETVGYRLKNDNKVSKNTRLEVITEGILTQIIQNDPELSGVGLIVLDEFHERSLHGDLAFALSRDIQLGLRDDLKLLLMSATLASEQLLSELPDAKGIVSEGRSFPIDICYQPPKIEKQWREHLVKVIQQVASDLKSSILVFLPGTADIHKVYNLLQNTVADTVKVLKLYGQLSIKEQQQVIAPAADGFVKIVLATNIAETSLTIDGVDLVIDSGLEKVATYHGDVLTNHLIQRKISKASAIQRAGRAGRLKAGRCIRIYSEEDFGRRAEHSDSEIQHADILPLLIESARWGVKSLNDLPLLELPSSNKEAYAWQELETLGLTHQHMLTELGHNVAHLPCHPRYARMIIKAHQLQQTQMTSGLLPLACLIAAMLEERDVFSGEQARYDCNITHRISAVLTNKSLPLAQNILQQAIRFMNGLTASKSAVSHHFNQGLPVEYTGVLLALAYPERIAKSRVSEGEYLSAQGKGMTIHHEDALASAPYIVAANVSSFTKSTLQVRLAAEVDINLLSQWQIIEPLQTQVLHYDEKRLRIISNEQVKLGDIVISEKKSNDVLQPEKIAQLWAQQVECNGISWLRFNDKEIAFLKRWRWVNQFVPECGLPKADDAALMASLTTWFCPYVDDIMNKKNIEKLNFGSMLQSLLTYQQQQLLEKVAPLFFIGPTGRKCPISYNEESSPKVSMPMQELYGMQVSPAVGITSDIAMQHSAMQIKTAIIPLTLELLSPAQRPIQITQDLATFWQGSYSAVQKDMKANYPKHYWPDDPANAKPTNKTKRHHS